MVTDNDITKHLRIFGVVQGVCYRAWSVEKARRLSLTGWVRNRKDGSVEALVKGPKDSVDCFVAECHNGPTAAKVESVQINKGTDEMLGTFEFRETL